MEHKEIRRNTAACEACQERKRKCDGTAPCAFCVSKKIECKFSAQKKRGPAKKRKAEAQAAEKITTVTVTSGPVSAIASTPHYLEAEMLDRVEARRYLTLYFRFDHHFLSNPIDTLLSPRTVAHKVQLFAAMADAAQSCGEFVKGRMFISQARVLSGSIYDHVDTDAVRGFMMMRKYFYHTLDFIQCSHFSSIAWSLAKLVKGNIDIRIKLSSQLSANMSDFTTPMEEKLAFLRNTVTLGKKRHPTGIITKEERLFIHYLTLAGDFMEHFDFNIFYPPDESVSTIFKDLRSIHLSQETRLKMLENINEIMLAVSDLKVEEYSLLVLINRVFCPLYQTLVNWRSGHITEAMSSALQCLQAFDAINEMSESCSANFLALVAGYTHICLIGSVLQFFVEQGQTTLADSIEKHIYTICKTRGPEYNPILEFIADFKHKQGKFHADPKISSFSPEPSPVAASPPSSSSSDESPSPPQHSDLKATFNALDLSSGQTPSCGIFNLPRSHVPNKVDFSDPMSHKQFTYQLVSQLNAISLKGTSEQRTARYGYQNDGGVKVNNAIIFKPDMNYHPPATISEKSLSTSSYTSTSTSTTSAPPISVQYSTNPSLEVPHPQPQPQPQPSYNAQQTPSNFFANNNLLHQQPNTFIQALPTQQYIQVPIQQLNNTQPYFQQITHPPDQLASQPPNNYINIYSPSAIYHTYSPTSSPNNPTTTENAFDVDSLSLMDQILSAPTENVQFQDPDMFLNNQVRYN